MSFLQNLYKSIPAVPSLVYLARKMNIMEDREDTPENGGASIADIIHLLLLEDFETLEEAHFMNMSTDKAEVPNFLKEKADRIHAQLALINELDQKLTTSLRSLEERVAEAKDALAKGTAESQNFESLFEDKPIHLADPHEPLNDAVQIDFDECPRPPVLKRSVAIS